MQKITSTIGLKNAIQLLEAGQSNERELLKEQFLNTCHSFKPVNLIRSSLTDISTSPYLIDNVLNTALGLATGYLSRKFFIGSSGNKLRKLLGSALQFGVINFVAMHHDDINSFGRNFFQHILHKKETNLETP